MKIRIVSLERGKHAFLQTAEDEYVSRIRRFAQIELIGLEAQRFNKLPDEERRKRETALAIESIGDLRPVIALDERGKQFTSEALAKYLSSAINRGTHQLTFAIGGALGWSSEMQEAATTFLSLSAFTFTSQMARMILAEQIYRAFTIMRGVPYHRG